jgi:hypothetical protein
MKKIYNFGITIGLIVLMAFSTEAFATRGRVQISNNTVKTDWGTLLRGCRVSLDIWDETPSQADITTMKNRGLNTLHIYAEYAGSGRPGGYNYAKVDNVVNLADQNGLYVILTIGCGGDNGSFNQTFVTQFWDFYAPRYKDRTHVVYELMNEPQAWSSPYNWETLNMEKNGYNQIRGLAPNTHIMMMSYAVPINPTQVADECANLGISWSNASVAFHGYGIDGNENNALTSLFSALRSKGIAYGACTEPSNPDDHINAVTTRIFEDNGVSYTHFMNVHTIATDNSRYYDVINYSGIRWTPDYGTWPSSSTGGTVVHMRKRNASSFAIDGNNGGANGQQIYLWSADVNNVNQAWVEIDRGGGYYSYQKLNTNYCIDGGNGGENGQLVILWTCDPNNQNQHWQKIDAGNSNYRLQKRNASGYSIDGNNGGENGQELYLWASDASNQNQQWTFSSSSLKSAGETEEVELAPIAEEISAYPNPVADKLNVELSEKDSRIELLSIQGKQLFTLTNIESPQIEIDMSEFNSGIYILRIVSDDQNITTQKILKK